MLGINADRRKQLMMNRSSVKDLTRTQINAIRKISTAAPHAITAIAQFGNSFSSFSVVIGGGSVLLGFVVIVGVVVAGTITEMILK